MSWTEVIVPLLYSTKKLCFETNQLWRLHRKWETESDFNAALKFRLETIIYSVKQSYFPVYLTAKNKQEMHFV